MGASAQRWSVDFKPCADDGAPAAPYRCRAGKTTTVEILEGFRRASDGTVAVLDHEPWRAPAAWRERIGIVLQESQAEPGLTVRECLELFAGYYRAPRQVDETLELAELGALGSARALAPPGGTDEGGLPESCAQRRHAEPGGRLALSSASVAADLHTLSGWALDRGLELEDLEVRRPTLEDIYLRLTAADQPRS